MRRAVVIFSLAIFALPVASQDAEAVRVVDRALEAVGGETKIRTFRSIYFSAKGFEDSEVNAQPFPPVDRQRVRTKKSWRSSLTAAGLRTN